MLESISQIDGQIVIKVLGDDTDVLRRVASEVLRAVSSVRGVARAFVDRAARCPSCGSKSIALGRRALA